jgi:hypothetical protein
VASWCTRSAHPRRAPTPPTPGGPDDVTTPTQDRAHPAREEKFSVSFTRAQPLAHEILRRTLRAIEIVHTLWRGQNLRPVSARPGDQRRKVELVPRVPRRGHPRMANSEESRERRSEGVGMKGKRSHEDLVRAAHHEVAHAVMALALRVPVDVISVRPTEHFHGIMISAKRTVPSQTSIGLSLPRLPADLRRYVESRVLVMLAGGLGAQLAGANFDDHEAEARAALAILHEPPVLTPREWAVLAAEENSTDPNAGDESNAREGARLLASSDEQASLYLGLLRSVCRDYVFHPAFAREVELLVPHLLKHSAISGRRAREIIKEGAA